MIRNNENNGKSPPGHDVSEPETWIWEMQADMCQVLCNPKRLQIINLLKWGERSVGDLEKALGVAKPNLSQHLSVMRQKGILTTRREGTVIYYRLAIPDITEACEIMRQVLLEALDSKSEAFRSMLTSRKRTAGSQKTKKEPDKK